MSANPLTHKLPQKLALAVQAGLEDWKKNDKPKRLWQRDASLWTGADESKWLGWLDIAQARGDFAVLAERGRRALRVHTGKNVLKDLRKLGMALRQALE